MTAMVRLVYVIVVALAPAYYGGFVLASKSNLCQKENFDKAKKVCSSSGQYLLSAEAVKRHIIASGLQKQEQTYWLPIKRKYLQTWNTLSGLPYEKIMYQWTKGEPAVDKSCAVIETKTMKWKAVDCFEEHNYACSHTYFAEPTVTSNVSSAEVNSKHLCTTGKTATTSRQGDDFSRSSQILVLLTFPIVLHLFILICIILKRIKNILLEIKKLSKELHAKATGKEPPKTDRGSAIEETVALL